MVSEENQSKESRGFEALSQPTPVAVLPADGVRPQQRVVQMIFPEDSNRYAIDNSDSPLLQLHAQHLFV